jgi:glutathione synthase/RimK-type ligase-like ATP-grasp enzyme
MDFVIATHRALPELSPSDRLLAAALAARGARVTARPWDAIDPRQTSGSVVCIRSTWDYHLRIGEFREWIGAFRAEPGRLWNPPETVLWNLDKHYLRGLERAGVALPVTRWLPIGEVLDLPALLRQAGWSQAVLKPRVSASAHGTLLVTPDSILSTGDAAHFSATGALLQEFIPEIRTGGEVSLMFFGGEYSHAVCKEPASGDFRVHAHLGGGARLIEAPAEVLAFGKRALGAVSSPWVYARIDIVHAERGPLLMELELIEPELFFHLIPERADLLAAGLIRHATQNPRE